jgi:hypothetical protein
MKFYTVAVAAVLAASVGNSAFAQAPQASRATVTAANTPLALPPGFSGAAPPELPATVSRDADGRTTVRVVRLTAPLRVDGALDEDIYRTVTPISDFIQVEPNAGAPATERTEVWLSFDSDNLYVSVRALESQPSRMIVNEMRRDSFNLFQNENFQFALDTFFDHRNSLSFQFNPAGGRMDGQITNENTFNGDWNPIWRLQVRRDATGWTAEAALPFKSIRYRPGTAQVWGVQFRRINRWKNEISYLTKLPANVGNGGHNRVSEYAVMVGLEVPKGGTRALDLKPFVASNISTDLTAATPVRNHPDTDFGFDAKYGVTQNLAADFTYHTDFAQVEADEQQVNLTRFSLFFPEKREFFLENQGLFTFAVPNTGNTDNDVPTVFYSRRIGLESGHEVPIDAGGRMSGRVGRYSVGVMNIQASDVDPGAGWNGVPSTNFAVARMKRDVLRRSSIGAIVTRRSDSVLGSGGDAESYGVDGGFAFFQNLYFNAYWAKTSTPGVKDADTSYRTQMFYNADRWGLQLDRLNVGDNFNPEVGFVRRDDFTRNRGYLRFSPRPRNRFRRVRKFTYQGFINYWTDGAGKLETRDQNLEFVTELQTSDKITARYQRNYERLDAPFHIANGVTVPAGGYQNAFIGAEFLVGQQRRASGTWIVEAGPFYDGHRKTLSYSSARVKINPHLAIEPGFSLNRVTLPYGDFTAKLGTARTTFTVTPLMFVSGLIQYNSSNNTLSSNVRFRWEYQPGSELFVVYNEARDTLQPGAPALLNRSIIFKVNRLFRY